MFPLYLFCRFFGVGEQSAGGLCWLPERYLPRSAAVRGNRRQQFQNPQTRNRIILTVCENIFETIKLTNSTQIHCFIATVFRYSSGLRGLDPRGQPVCQLQMLNPTPSSPCGRRKLTTNQLIRPLILAVGFQGGGQINHSWQQSGNTSPAVTGRSESYLHGLGTVADVDVIQAADGVTGLVNICTVPPHLALGRRP